MKIIKTDKMIEIHECDDFVPKLVFDCGQCFRWNSDGVGIANGKIARVKRENDIVYIECNPEDFESFWAEYFDIDTDYEKIRATFTDSNLSEAMEFGKGIRILKQDTWEALISFIISQCNNIPRIRSIIEKMCSIFGEEVEGFGVKRFSFPDAKTLANCTLSDLEPLRAGYRAKYILNAARLVASGEVDLNEIKNMPTCLARKELLKLEGVGNKVADCVLLFGMGKLDAFPIDVWMKRALDELYGGKTPDFGEFSGIAQQYLFHYMRNK